MKPDTATLVPSIRPQLFAPCAQCGDTLIGPEWSEHVSERRVRHFWSCDSCNYQFETMVVLAQPERALGS